MNLADLTPRNYVDPMAGLSGNVKIFIENHPDSFDALLFRADPAVPEAVAVGTDVVGSIESTERTLAYATPVSTKIVIIPDPNPREVEIEGDNISSAAADPVVLLISADSVPQQSVIQYRETIDENNTLRDVSLYVHHIEQVGSGPGVCKRYYCLPMQDFEDLVP